MDKKGLVRWLQLACTLYGVSQAYRFEEGNFRRRNQSTPPERLLSATLGEVLVQKASHQSYQGYLLHLIIQILSLSSPFGVSTPSHLSRSGYTPAPALAPAPAHILPQLRHPFKRAEKCP